MTTAPTPTEINALNDTVTPLLLKLSEVREMITAQTDVNNFYWIKWALTDIDDRLHELEGDLSYREEVPGEVDHPLKGKVS